MLLDVQQGTYLQNATAVLLDGLLIVVSSYEVYILIYLSHVHMSQLAFVAYIWHLKGILVFGMYI